MLSPKYSDFFKYLLNYCCGQPDFLIDEIIFNRSDTLFIKIFKEN